MSKNEALRLAEEYVLRHKPSFKKGKNAVTKKEINMAVRRVARALQDLGPARTSLR